MISEHLKCEIEKYASDRLRSSNLFNLARGGEVTPAAMAFYIANLRVLVKATEVNLRLAEARAKELERPGLAAYFAHKRAEEDGHERWADEDISRLKTQFVVEPTPGTSPAIRDLLRYLRQEIQDEPIRYLAYMLLAEYLTVLLGPELLALLEERCGIPSTSLTVIGHHVELDREHASEGLREIDAIVNDSESLDAMRQTMQASMNYFETFWNETCDVVWH